MTCQTAHCVRPRATEEGRLYRLRKNHLALPHYTTAAPRSIRRCPQRFFVAYALVRAASRLLSTHGCRRGCRHGGLQLRCFLPRPPRIDHRVHLEAGYRGGRPSQDPSAAHLAGRVVKGSLSIAALPDIPAEDALVELGRARNIGSRHLKQKTPSAQPSAPRSDRRIEMRKSLRP
jgi:hypothetical protein